MENKDKINIDDLLNQHLQNHESNDFPAFDLMKTQIDIANSNNISFDDFLQEKLEVVEEVKDNKWKKFIFLFWFRKVKKAAIVLIIVATIGYGLNSFFQTNKTVNNIQSENKSIESEIEGEKSEIKKSKSNNLTIQNDNKKLVKIPLNYSTKIKSINTEYKTNATIILQSDSIIEYDSERLAVVNNMKKMDLKPFTFEFENAIVEKVKKENKQQKNKLSVLPSGNYVIGFNLIGSQQSYKSDIEETNDKKLNRNYREISSNGNKKSNVINYGFSIERTFHKGFGASIGINKMTLLKSQQVNYELNEVPVIDINGEIAGYIQITPDKIQEKVESKIQYISFPVQLSYSLQFKEINSFQFKLGTNILSEISNKNYKYDYTTLQLSSYHNDSKKQSFTNIQYGMYYNRNITNKFILGLGYERQSLGKVNSLSDKTEKVKSTINNIGISFKIQL